MSNQKEPTEILKQIAFKKIALTSTLLISIFITFTIISTLSLFAYVQSAHFSRLVQSQINKTIPGKMEWSNFYLSILKGELALKDYKLSLNSNELIAIDNFHISVVLSNILNFSELLSMLKTFDFDISKIISNNLIIDKITIENPRISISINPDNTLDIASAFINSSGEQDQKEEKKKEPFNLPFNIIVNALTLSEGTFKYSGQSDKESQNPEPIAIVVEDINFQANGNVSNKLGGNSVNINFTLSMKSYNSDLTIRGNIKDNFFVSNPIVDLTADANLMTLEILNMLGLVGKENQNISGKLSIHATVAGNLNDPSVTCEIDSPDNRVEIMGRGLKRAALSIAMEKREITIKNLEFEPLIEPKSQLDSIKKLSSKGFLKDDKKNYENRVSDKSLKASGTISLAKAFPQGFLSNISDNTKKREQIDINKISGHLTILGDNINIGKLLESENIEGIKGIGSFKADFDGSLNNPEVKFILKANNASYQDYPVLDSGDIDILLTDGVLNIRKFDIASCDSLLKLDGTLKVLEPKKDGTFTLISDPVFNLFVNSDRLNLTKILESFNVLKDQKIIATLIAKSKITGTLKNPKVALNVTGKNLELIEQKIENISLKAGYQNRKTIIDSLLIALDNNNAVEAKGWIDQSYPLKQQQNANLKQSPKFKLDIFSKGVDLSLIQSIKKYSAIKGVASGNISAEGRFNALYASNINGNISLKKVEIMDKPFQDFSAKLALKDNRVNINGRLNFDVAGNFDLKSKEFGIRGDFNKTELLPWFKFAEVEGIENGKVTGIVDIKGNTNNLDKILANCDLKELSLTLSKDSSIFLKDSNLDKSQFLVQADNIKAWIDGKKFKVDKFKTLLPENGTLVVAASGDIGGNIKADATAILPVRFASVFVKDMPDIKGALKLKLKADIKHSDDIKNSDIDAIVEFVDIGVTLPVMESADGSGTLKFQNINGTIKGDLNSVEIVNITGKISDNIIKQREIRDKRDKKKSADEKKFLESGEFRLSGKARLADFMIKDIDATLIANAIPINMVEDLKANFDTELHFTGDIDSSSKINGKILLNQGEWRGDIHVEKKLLSTLTEKSRVRKEIKQKNEINPILENMQLNIAIKGKKPFIVNNNLAYIEIHPDIRIRGSAASPLVSGRSEIDPGIINYQSTEFELTRGIIDFINPYKIEPELDIQSHRKIRDWDILLAISGTPDNLNFKLASEPRLEDGDIISLLLRGRTVTELINAEGGTTLSAAGMLSQVAASAVSNRVKSSTGLDIFEVGFNNKNSTSTNSDDNGIGDFNVTVGKELTERITVKYGTENKDGIMVGTTSAEYKLMDNVSVSGFQDSEGQFGGEVRYRLEFK